VRDDDDETGTAARHNELRDIHHRIDALKEEAERQFNSLTEKLHALEVAIATGSRFPATAWVAATGILLTVLGTAFVTFAKLESAAVTGNKAISLIERHMEGSSERFASIRETKTFTEEWERRLPLLEGRPDLEESARRDFLIFNRKDERRDALEIARFLREQGYSVARDIIRRDLESSLEYARKVGIRRVMVIGGDDLPDDQVRVLNVGDGHAVQVAKGELLRGILPGNW